MAASWVKYTGACDTIAAGTGTEQLPPFSALWVLLCLGGGRSISIVLCTRIPQEEWKGADHWKWSPLVIESIFQTDNKIL